ncbi:MAG: hypothetical protein IPM76_20915 [Chloroflexi bacterium]|nr:hypothetical protein [Chloroflexota bacterium]
MSHPAAESQSFVTSVPNPVVDSNGVGPLRLSCRWCFGTMGTFGRYHPFNVTFYSNAAMTNVIGMASPFTPAVEGCAMVPCTAVGVTVGQSGRRHASILGKNRQRRGHRRNQ